MKHYYQPMHSMLKENRHQHRQKNLHSMKDDAILRSAVEKTINELQRDFPNHSFRFSPSLSIQEAMLFSGEGMENMQCIGSRKIIPDGGIIWMDRKYPILISEMKYQGTNSERLKEGKSRQAMGNAIERYGKNLMVLQTMFSHEDFLPCAVFCWGCDFDTDYIQAKLLMMNNFQSINQIYGKTHMGVKPHNIFCKNKPWEEEQLFTMTYSMAKKYCNYYLQKE